MHYVWRYNNNAQREEAPSYSCIMAFHVTLVANDLCGAVVRRVIPNLAALSTHQLKSFLHNIDGQRKEINPYILSNQGTSEEKEEQPLEGSIGCKNTYFLNALTAHVARLPTVPANE